MEWKDYLLFGLILIAAFCLYKLIKVMRENEKKEKQINNDQKELLRCLNDSDFPIIAVDDYAERIGEPCTRFLAPGWVYGKPSYLCVFIDEEHYEFIGSDRNWEILNR